MDARLCEVRHAREIGRILLRDLSIAESEVREWNHKNEITILLFCHGKFIVNQSDTSAGGSQTT
jgi:hypothetical protein